MNLKPLGDRVIVRAIEAEGMTVTGIIIPDVAKEKPQKGEILAVGEGAYNEDGSLRSLRVDVGDEVLYSKYGGTEIEIDGEVFLILRETDVLAKVR